MSTKFFPDNIKISLIVCSVTQSCPILWDPMDGSLLGSSVHGIFQARILEWVATAYSKGSSWLRDQICVSEVIINCISQINTIWKNVNIIFTLFFHIKMTFNFGHYFVMLPSNCCKMIIIFPTVSDILNQINHKRLRRENVIYLRYFSTPK